MASLSPTSPKRNVFAANQNTEDERDSPMEEPQPTLSLDNELAAGLRGMTGKAKTQEKVRFNNESPEQESAAVKEGSSNSAPVKSGAPQTQQTSASEGAATAATHATLKRSDTLLDAAKHQKPETPSKASQAARKTNKQKSMIVKKQTTQALVRKPFVAKQKWAAASMKVVAISRLVDKKDAKDEKTPVRRRGGVSISYDDDDRRKIHDLHVSRKDVANVLASSHEMMVENELLTMPVFAKCSQEFIKSLSSVGKSHRFNAGNVIATQGNKGSSIIIVLRGVVDMLVCGDKVLSLTQGQYFGETLLLGLESYWTATLQVAATCVVCEITRDSFLEVLKKHPPDYAFDQIVDRNKDCLSDGTLVNTCVIFNGLSDRTLCEIDTNLVRRIIFPGETILHEGTPGDELYILIRGTAHVTIAGRLVRVEKQPSFPEASALETDDEEEESAGRAIARMEKRGSKLADARPNGVVCFGELGLLGLQDLRTATVVAETVLHVRVLYRPVFRRILNEHGDAIGSSELGRVFKDRYSDNANRIPPAQLLREVPIFIEVGCSQPFLDFLAEHLEDRIFMPDQKIIDENNPDDRCMYLICDGLAKVVKNGAEITQLSNGAVCGEINVLGLASKRTATIVALKTCYLQVLHQSVVVRGLELFPEERKKVLMMAFKGHAINQQQANEKAPQARMSKGPLPFADEMAPGSRGRGSGVLHETLPMTQRGSIRALDNCKVSRKTRVSGIKNDISGGSRLSKSRISGISVMRSHSPVELLDDDDDDEALAGLDPAGRLRSKTLKQRAVMAQALQGSPLFADIGTNFIEELSLVATDRIYMPGDMIIEQGKKGDSMFVMVSGQAAVYAVETYPTGRKPNSANNTDEEDGFARPARYVSRVGSLAGGSVGGELAMLGVSQTRSATIEAESICSMWEITQEEALPIIERFPDAQKHFANIIVEHLERTVATRILSLPLFRGFDRKFRTLLGIYCERRAYFPGQWIVREGSPGERMYVINLGRTRLEKKSVNVKMYASGTHFGSTVMLGMHKAYIGTLIALQTCHLLAITRNAYQAALEQYPSLGAAQEMCRAEKANEEVLREAVQRSATRKLIWKRYQLLVMDPANVQPFGQNSDKSERDTLERYIQAWHNLTKYLQQRREQLKREHLKRKEVMENWLNRRSEAMERARQRRLEDQMDELPDYLRGNVSGNDTAEERAETTLKLPTVPLPPGEAERRDLVTFMQDWPAPRPSPHYRLRIYGVLKEAVVTAPSGASPLLPLLKSKGDQKLGSNKARFSAPAAEEVTDGPPSGFLGEAPRAVKDEVTSAMRLDQTDGESSSDGCHSEEYEANHHDLDEDGGEDAAVVDGATPLPSNGATPLPITCTAEGMGLKLPPIHNEEITPYCMTPPMSASSMASGRGVLL